MFLRYLFSAAQIWMCNNCSPQHDSAAPLRTRGGMNEQTKAPRHKKELSGKSMKGWNVMDTYISYANGWRWTGSL